MLRSAFCYNEGTNLNEDVLRLFTDMVDAPTKNVEYVQEIIDAAQQVRVNLEKDFNLAGYCYKISQNTMLKANSRKKKETFYFEDDGMDDSDWSKYSKQGGISLTEATVRSTRFNDLAQGFEALEDDSEFLDAINTIKNLRDDFLINEGVDLIMLIKQALKYFPQAIDELKKICEDFELVGEQIKIILSSKKDIEHYLEFA